MDRLKNDFTTITLVMIPVGIAINIAIGTIVFRLGLPLYLDSIGTVFVAVIAGPWVGALTGLLSNLIWGLSGINPIYAPYAPVALVIGLMAGFFAQAGWFRQWWKAILAGIITGIVAAIISAPITAYLFGGVTGSGTDAVVAFFRFAGASVLEAALGQGIVSDPLDKAITFLLVFLIVRALPLHFLDRFPRAEAVH
jgi:energy-coupling factor transport system substrate-specific component